MRLEITVNGQTGVLDVEKAIRTEPDNIHRWLFDAFLLGAHKLEHEAIALSEQFNVQITWKIVESKKQQPLELKQPTEQQWIDYDIALSVCDRKIENLINLEHLDIQSRLDAVESYLEGFASTRDARYIQAKAICNALLEIKIKEENEIAEIKKSIRTAIYNGGEKEASYKGYTVALELLDDETIGVSLMKGELELDACSFDCKGNYQSCILAWIKKVIQTN